MIDVELTDPVLVTAGYVGEPGDRTFYIQAADENEVVSIVCEKQQVAGLADLVAKLLDRLDDAPATDWDRAAMALREPIEPRWRAGDISVGLDVERGRFLIEIEELSTDDDELDPLEVRIWTTRDQARRLAAHAEESVGEGRPVCELCNRPMAPDGDHVCPRTNGHGRLSR